jgi:glycosyltransferase involved in cell wall biosynthesis
MKKTIKAFNTGGLDLPDDATFLHLSPFQPGGLFGGAIRSSETTRMIKQVYPNSYTIHCWNILLEEKPMPSFLAGHTDVLSDVKMLYIDFKVELYLEAIPDAVIFDHPWLWNEAKKIKKMFPHCKIIHSSQNIEWKLKENLLDKLDKDTSNKIISLVKNLEIEIAKEADLIICCTDSDKQWFLDNEAKDVIVANNGTSIKVSQVESGKKYAFTVGSGHPPNIAGSLKYLNNATEWLPEDTDLIFVGEMCDGLKGALGKERDEDKNSTIRFLGSRNNDELAKLIQSASVIVLPIPYGGGSNLKTSEALVSGRPIVGTTVSFRGFKEFMYAKNVVVTDDIEEFHNAVKTFCNKKLPTVKRTNIESLSWDSTFKEFIKYITSNN